MKSFTVFFIIIHIIIGLNMHMSAGESAFKRIEKFITNHCPQFGNNKNLRLHVANSVNQLLEQFHTYCDSQAENVCEKLKDNEVKHSAGGHQQCKEELGELFCAEKHHYRSSVGADIHDSYLDSTLKIVLKTDKMTERREQEVCALLTPNNTFLRNLAKYHICKLIGKKLARARCHKTDFHSLRMD